MNQPLDPAAAQEALTVVADQRRQVNDAAWVPWWVWTVNFLVLFAIGAVQDLGQGVTSVVDLLVPAALIIWMALLRYSPRVGERIGMGVRAHPALVPAPWRAFIWTGMVAVAFAVSYIGDDATRLLRSAGAPVWALRHPHSVVAVAGAVMLTAVGLAGERALRARAGRRAQ